MDRAADCRSRIRDCNVCFLQSCGRCLRHCPEWLPGNERADEMMDTGKKRRVRAWAVSIVAVCFAGWLSLVAYVNWAMHQPPEVFGHVMAKMPMPAYFVLPFETLWMRARKGHLSAGNAAPNLTVKKL